MCMGACLIIYIHDMCAWYPRSQKKVLHTLELELLIVVSWYVGAENQPRFSATTASALKHWAIALASAPTSLMSTESRSTETWRLRRENDEERVALPGTVNNVKLWSWLGMTGSQSWQGRRWQASFGHRQNNHGARRVTTALSSTFWVRFS